MQVVPSRQLAAAKAALALRQLDLAIVDGDEILVTSPPIDQQLAGTASLVAGPGRRPRRAGRHQAAGLTADPGPAAGPAPSRSRCTSLQPSSKAPTKTTSVIGLVLVFFMLTQYNTWILIGVMEEKSSRVVEVLLGRRAAAPAPRAARCWASGWSPWPRRAHRRVRSRAGRGRRLRPAPRARRRWCWRPSCLAGPRLRLLLLGLRRRRLHGRAPGSGADARVPADHSHHRRLHRRASPVASTGTPACSSRSSPTFPRRRPSPCRSSWPGRVTWWAVLVSVLLAIAGTVGVAPVAARIYRRAVLRSGQRSLDELAATGIGTRRRSRPPSIPAPAPVPRGSAVVVSAAARPLPPARRRARRTLSAIPAASQTQAGQDVIGLALGQVLAGDPEAPVSRASVTRRFDLCRHRVDRNATRAPVAHPVLHGHHQSVPGRVGQHRDVGRAHHPHVPHVASDALGANSRPRSRHAPTALPTPSRHTDRRLAQRASRPVPTSPGPHGAALSSASRMVEGPGSDTRPAASARPLRQTTERTPSYRGWTGPAPCRGCRGATARRRR